MDFILDPSSGFADSYLDVEFSVVIPDHPKAIIHIHNEISGDQLQILGTSSGYILGGNKLIVENKTSTTGHINIFNDDKMNKKFLAHRSVTLKCVAEFYDKEDNKIGEEKESVIFYNETQSLDADIIPFDLIINNRTINLDENEPLNIDIISDIVKKYEICISSLDERNRCHIEISAKKGKTSIVIPGEFLYYDLGLKNNKNKKFKFFYVKHQGTQVSRMANRQYIPVKDSELKFQISDGLTPVPQQRYSPTGKLLNDDFIISDRYLVMCPRARSGFSGKSSFGREKLMDLTMMLHEGQNMMSLSLQIQKLSKGDDAKKIEETKRSLHLENQAKSRIRRPQISGSQVQLMNEFSKAYDAISSRIVLAPPVTPKGKEKSVNLMSNLRSGGKGGCPSCSRKKAQNA